MDRIAINEAKAAFDLVGAVRSVVELEKAGDEWMGPCPKCGGTDRFHVKADGWFCRKCSEDGHKGLWRDAIQYYRWMDDCTFSEALAKIAGDSAVIGHSPVIRAPVKKASKAAAVIDPEWQGEATEIAKAAVCALADPGGQPGRDYLESRGIHPATWQAYGLGYDPAVALPGTWDKKKREHIHPKQPAIVVPWFRAGKVVAIRYRFLKSHTYVTVDKAERTSKQSAFYGSNFAGILYGGQTIKRVAPDSRTLVIVEGEWNALSIWQVANDTKLDVLSAGSESQRLTDSMVRLAATYGRVILWADREKVAKDWIRRVPFAYGVTSPDEKDANDLLQSGRLGAYLVAWRFGVAQSTDEKRRLYHDLYDAHHLGIGLDDGAVEEMNGIAVWLGLKSDQPAASTVDGNEDLTTALGYLMQVRVGADVGEEESNAFLFALDRLGVGAEIDSLDLDDAIVYLQQLQVVEAVEEMPVVERWQPAQPVDVPTVSYIQRQLV